METPSNNIDSKNSRRSGLLGKVMWIALAGVFLVIVLAVWSIRSCSVKSGPSGKFGITPVQIVKIKSIGQWEFLAISDEELMDTVRHGFFGDAELARIYYGTLRLGIDLNEVGPDWITMDHDTVVAVLPPIKLLDENFIDEARTQAFFEDGKWNENAKAELTLRAAEVMKRRCLTPANIQAAQRNAVVQFGSLLRSMGFTYSRISFGEKAKAGEGKK